MTSVTQRPGVDSGYAWRLAFLSMFCIGLGGGSIYLPVVGLKEIAAEFGDSPEALRKRLARAIDRVARRFDLEGASDE